MKLVYILMIVCSVDVYAGNCSESFAYAKPRGLFELVQSKIAPKSFAKKVEARKAGQLSDALAAISIQSQSAKVKSLIANFSNELVDAIIRGTLRLSDIEEGRLLEARNTVTGAAYFILVGGKYEQEYVFSNDAGQGPLVRSVESVLSSPTETTIELEDGFFLVMNGHEFKIVSIDEVNPDQLRFRFPQ
jgi:hypothetical protein